jgi:hypothetical protein
MPHTGWQFVPPAVSVQVTPALVTSLVSVALILTAGPPTVWELNFGPMLTVTGAVIWKLKIKTCWASSCERTVIVADEFSGCFTGGVYTALRFGAKFEVTFSVPQSGEQSVFATDNVQLTPILRESPATLALSVTGKFPASIVLKAGETVTTIPCAIAALADCGAAADEDLHAPHHPTAATQTAAKTKRLIELRRVPQGIRPQLTAAGKTAASIGKLCEYGDTVRRIFRDFALASWPEAP